MGLNYKNMNFKYVISWETMELVLTALSYIIIQV